MRGVRRQASGFRVGALTLLPLLVLPAACGDADEAVVPLEVAAAGASNPTVAFGADGAPLIAWVGGAETEDVWLARIDSGTVRAPVRVNDVAGDAAAHAQAPAQVAVAPDGAVYVLWQNNTPIEGRRFPASDLRFARSDDGGRTFTPAITVNDDAGGPPSSHTFHDLAVAADGTVYASWIDGRRDDPAGPDIRVARSSDGGRTFGPSTVVARAACPCCRTSLAIADDGTVYLAWRHVFEGSVRDIVVARSRDGGATFDAPVRVHADGWVYDGCPHAGPSVAVARDGSLHVAWYTGATGGRGLYHAVSHDGGATFGAAHALSEGDDVPTSQVALAAAPDGAVWAAWEALGEDGVHVRAARVDEGGVRDDVTELPRGLLPALAARQGALALALLDGESVRAFVVEADAR